jgi:hypothetical protein
MILAGFLLVFGGLLFSLRPRIRKIPQKERGNAPWAAWWAAATGVLIVAVGIIVEIVGAHSTGKSIGVAGFYILIGGSAGAYIVTQIVDEAGGKRVLTSTVLMFGFFALFPSSFVLLITGQWPAYWLGPQTSSRTEVLVLILVPSLLVIVPQVVSVRRTWESASKEVRAGLPAMLANLAATATCIYAVALHFASGPVKAVPLDRLVVAILSIIVILRPFYKAIAEECWKSGPAKTLLLHDWRRAQLPILREIRLAVWKVAAVSDVPDDADQDAVVDIVDNATAGDADTV